MLDPLNCTEVHSVPSLNHPSAREDVRMIAAHAQIAKGNCCYAKATTADWRFSEGGTHEETLHPQDQEGEL